MKIPQKDLNLLTELWHRSTNRLNGQIDDEFKLVQDEAYKIAAASAQSELTDLRTQRDSLLEACKSAEQWLMEWASAEPQLAILRAAISGATVNAPSKPNTP